MPASPTSEKIPSSQHIVYICSRFIAFNLPLVFFMVVNSFYLKTYDSAQIKITLTQIGATVLAFAWLVKILVDGRFPFSKSDLVYVAPFLAFLASGLIVWLHTPFKEWSLEETLRRVFYMIFALLVVAEFRTNERMTRLWRWLMAAAWVTLGYGLLQYLDGRLFPPPAQGIDPFIWRGAFGPRVFSTFGNPNFYGNFLVIMTPLILASVFRGKGSLVRPFVVIPLIIGIVLLTDKMTRGFFGGFDPSLRYVYGTAVIVLLFLFIGACTWRVGTSASLPMFLVLFALLFLNLYATETKGAWIGFIAALSATIWLIFEYFLNFEERMVEPKRYMSTVAVLVGLLTLTIGGMVVAFVIPWLRGTATQVGFQILWIPTAIAAVASVFMILKILKKPWNLKKLVYGFLLFFVVTMGAGVLQYSKTRLLSVSFRMFTWISTWEMVRTNPILGNGVGTFKVIYPAHRRPEIIALETRSNTETDHAEDEYLETWQDEGIVGFGILIWMVTTAMTFGFKQLNWYHRHRRTETGRARKIFDIDSDPRSYEVLGYLGAYIGASIHWFVDVSIRFVSSGIFSGLLPGVLVAYARNHDQPIANEVRLPYDRWIRIGTAAFWTGIMLWLKMELVPQSLIQNGDTSQGQIVFWVLLMGAAIYAMIELLEMGNAPEKEVKFSEQYPPVNSGWFGLRLAALPLVTAACLWTMVFAADQFWGDVHHNLAIFFSKESIWTKSPAYDQKVMSLPPDIRSKYQETGGALEHYKEVVRLNHAFPMAYYFTGNVYNDWGSQVNAESMNARAKGDMEEAERLKNKAIDMWDKSDAAYTDTKRLAPNYVQTHHQVGLLYVKRAEQAAAWGNQQESKTFYQKALENFRKYWMLDPVFTPNYDRMVQILLMDGKIQESIDLYKEALYYNDDVSRHIHNRNVFPDRVAALSVALAKLYFNQVANNPAAFHSPPAPQILEAIKYFKRATENDPNNAEAWKGLGFLLEKTGQAAQAQIAYREVLKLSPNDHDLRIK